MKKDQELLDAARTGNLQVVEKLLTPRSKSSTLAASLGIKVGANVNCQDQSGYTPLHHAALNGHRDVVTYMLEHAASVNISDSKGNFPLHLAAWSGNHNIVYTLLTHGPSIAKINEKNGDNETSLHCASQHGHSETVRVLLDNGADPSVRNIHDESPLDLASQYGRLDVVRLLLHYQPSLLSRFPECFSPLHLASRNGHKEVVELLLAHGADINRGGENGSALHEAALFGKSDVVKLLLSRGANPHTLDPKSRTALELVKQLDTQTSREIGQLILSRMQEGEDYEPISPVANLSLTSVCLRRFLNDTTIPESPHTETDMSKAFLEGTDRPDPEPPAKPPQVVVEDYYVDVPPKLNASFHPSPHHPRGILSGWSKASLNLRRSASARSSKSLPRLPSSRSRSPGSSIASPELPIRQHHPSSNMFPVSPTCRRRSGEASKLRRSSSSLPATSLSVMSLPTIPVKQSLRRSETVKPYLRDPLKSEDDSVFLPLTPTKGVKAKRSQSMEPRVAPTQYQDLRKVNQEVVDGPRKDSKPEIFKDRESKLSVDSMNVSPSSNRPKKPVRSKLSTVSSPPPIPPKPPSMADLPKIRPPSPKNPPPDEDSDLADETDGDDEESKESEVADKIVESSTEEKQASLEKATKCEDGFNCGSRNSVNDASNLLPVGIPAHKLVDKIRGLEAPSSESGSKKDSTTSSLSSPRRSPSPAVSPPSPHSAMIEISQTLQNALSLDIKHEKTNSEKETLDISRLEASTPSLMKKSAVDQVSIDKAITTPALPETSKLQVSALPSSAMHEVKPPLTSSMTLSVLAKTATLEKEVEVTVVTPQIKKNLPTSMQKDQVAIEANTDNERTKEQLSTMQEPREQIATTAKVPSANADTSNKPKTYISEAIVVPTRKSKPAIPNKPSLKPKPQIKPKPQLGKKPVENSSTTKQGAQVKTVSNESEDTIHDSSKCYVTGGAEIKRARILSTRSTDSGPVTTVSVDLDVPDETDPDLTPKADQELTPVVDPLTGYFQSNSARRNFEAHHAKDNTGHKFDLPPPPPVHVLAPPHHLMREKSDDATPVNEDVHFHYDVPKAVPKKMSPPTLKKIPDKHKEEDPQTESSSSIASWDDALSDRTEDFDMPVEVRKFRVLV
ncbi:unnamed protein product [Clavelina lepadiformis]|uniref:Uncharacterized protein n=1 Tax=Clavelina lepadiformis TaxID=159417 RepID=A0ABP0FA42_CLALP